MVRPQCHEMVCVCVDCVLVFIQGVLCLMCLTHSCVPCVVPLCMLMFYVLFILCLFFTWITVLSLSASLHLTPAFYITVSTLSNLCPSSLSLSSLHVSFFLHPALCLRPTTLSSSLSLLIFLSPIHLPLQQSLSPPLLLFIGLLTLFSSVSYLLSLPFFFFPSLALTLSAHHHLYIAFPELLSLTFDPYKNILARSASTVRVGSPRCKCIRYLFGVRNVVLEGKDLSTPTISDWPVIL